MKSVQIYPTSGHPVVYGAWTEAPGAPTVLVYGHYDVQPVDPVDEWVSPPFEPTERDGKLFARGSTDDKGQIFAQIKAVQSLMQANNGKLPVNVKFVIEGEEEISSTHLDGWIEGHKELVEADACVISDSQVLDMNRPLITYSVRGLTYMELEVWGPSHDLHSGSYGGTVHNPLQVLCEIIANLHNPDGSIAVPGFYDKVRQLDAAEREAIAKIPWTDAEWHEETGAPQAWGEAGYTLRERIGTRPTLEINGIIGGFTAKGSKTVLPAKGMAKISCRLVADQDPYEIEELVRARIKQLTPPTVKSELRGLNYAYPAAVPIDDPAMVAARAAYKRGFGAEPVFLPEGGTLPIVATLRNMFNMPVVLLGFGLPDDGAHAPNEKFLLDGFYRGINTAIAMFEETAKQH
jgi:acetylornithine deacetylase/succinyl-diaminopimelate desuccinylase-like protein